MRKVGAMVDSMLYSKLRQYQLDQAIKGRKLKIGEAIIELLERGLAAVSADEDVPSSSLRK
ncbi:hypothetical protein [Fibrella forsythiae]|uniref:Uncharacterized protein n=1 Tax=Fibrella forsythiae TaxID=2817061 RepID=A0ABS3JL23_9BACT|nr:hypothetical protein [Fibrella forsythiae]MBO0950700.1 hypothetical protein [Fibrella forsythiae]